MLRQVLGFDYLQDMVTLLQLNMFSVIIDEATHRSTQKQLAIVVVFFNLGKFESQYFLVDLAETEDGTANGIYSKMKQTFKDLNIPITNIVGFSSDTTNVMFGQNHSISQLLKCEMFLSSNPPSVLTSCFKATKNGRRPMQRVFAHFHRSSKRQDTFKEFQSFFEIEPHKLLSPAQTQWLSLQECVSRLLKQYEALKHYFIFVANDDPSHTNGRILASLQNSLIQAYYKK